jgi:hypothetical protein
MQLTPPRTPRIPNPFPISPPRGRVPAALRKTLREENLSAALKAYYSINYFMHKQKGFSSKIKYPQVCCSSNSFPHEVRMQIFNKNLRRRTFILGTVGYSQLLHLCKKVGLLSPCACSLSVSVSSPPDISDTCMHVHALELVKNTLINPSERPPRRGGKNMDRHESESGRPGCRGVYPAYSPLWHEGTI